MQLDCFLSIGVGKCFPLIKRGEMFFHVAWWVGSTPGGGDSHCSVDLLPGQIVFSGAAYVPSILKWCGAFWWASSLPCKMALFLCPFPHLYMASTSLTSRAGRTRVLSSLLSWKFVSTQHRKWFCFEFCCYRAFQDRRLRKWNLKRWHNQYFLCCIWSSLWEISSVSLHYLYVNEFVTVCLFWEKFCSLYYVYLYEVLLELWIACHLQFCLFWSGSLHEVELHGASVWLLQGHRPLVSYVYTL